MYNFSVRLKFHVNVYLFAVLCFALLCCCLLLLFLSSLLYICIYERFKCDWVMLGLFNLGMNDDDDDITICKPNGFFTLAHLSWLSCIFRCIHICLIFISNEECAFCRKFFFIYFLLWVRIAHAYSTVFICVENIVAQLTVQTTEQPLWGVSKAQHVYDFSLEIYHFFVCAYVCPHLTLPGTYMCAKLCGQFVNINEENSAIIQWFLSIT